MSTCISGSENHLVKSKVDSSFKKIALIFVGSMLLSEAKKIWSDTNLFKSSVTRGASFTLSTFTSTSCSAYLPSLSVALSLKEKIPTSLFVAIPDNAPSLLSILSHCGSSFESSDSIIEYFNESFVRSFISISTNADSDNRYVNN